MSPNVDSVYGSQRYLKAQQLPQGRYVPAVIDRVTLERLRGEGGEADRLVVYFVGKQKGLVLNTTNANRIAELIHNKNTDFWTGWTIQLYATMVEFGGKRVPAIRVNDQPGSAVPPVGGGTPTPRQPAAVRYPSKTPPREAAPPAALDDHPLDPDAWESDDSHESFDEPLPEDQPPSDDDITF
jgi:hypothetical protein